jgi:hypothetical protein
VCESRHNLALDRDPMGVDLTIECLTEGDCIFGGIAGGQVMLVEPEVELIKKMEAR